MVKIGKQNSERKVKRLTREKIPNWPDRKRGLSWKKENIRGKKKTKAGKEQNEKTDRNEPLISRYLQAKIK